MAKCDYITGERKEGEDSIWGEVYHTVGEGQAGGVVALVLVTGWES